MADVFDSSDDGSEFSGFTDGDLRDVGELVDVGSDISVSPVSSPDISSSEESSDDENDGVTWSRNLRKPINIAFSENVGATFTLTREKRELDFFMTFFPKTLIELIIKETNEYAARCIRDKADRLWKPVTYDEMKAFFGIHVLMSVIQIPSYTVGWKTKWPFSIPSIPQIMQRTRFEKISKYFHCKDTSTNPPRRQPGHDKLCHVRPILDEILRLCLENYDPPKEQSVDEGMIAFKGRLSFKQYLPAKPTKFGIKVWERAAPSNGYCHEFQVYTGKKDQVGGREEGLGSRVVKDLTEILIGKGHHVYMDNFFSSPELYDDLYAKDIYCCGTVRGNRKGMPEAIKSSKLKNRGDSITMQRGQLCAWAWKDKKNVFYIATNSDPTEHNTVPRRQKDGTLRDVPCPIVAQSYNKYMFGVDRADLLRMQYSTCRKALKWWKYLFWFCFDLAIVNSFVCMKESPDHKIQSKRGREITRTQMSFRMELAQQLIGAYRGSRKRKVVSNVDNCGNTHWPVRAEKRGRCKMCTKEKRRHEVFIQCKQCQIYLCVDNGCFERWHIQNMN